MGSRGNPLEELQEWYAAQCDGDWEHDHGIRISTLDNPGWSLSINLAGMEGRAFAAMQVDRTETDWIHCRLEEGFFRGWGGPHNLSELISVFLHWPRSPS